MGETGYESNLYYLLGIFTIPGHLCYPTTNCAAFPWLTKCHSRPFVTKCHKVICLLKYFLLQKIYLIFFFIFFFSKLFFKISFSNIFFSFFFNFLDAFSNLLPQKLHLKNIFKIAPFKHFENYSIQKYIFKIALWRNAFSKNTFSKNTFKNCSFKKKQFFKVVSSKDFQNCSLK